ncbi:MAG: hypothetical protein AABM29_07295 [Actinomycetota bacterium]
MEEFTRCSVCSRTPLVGEGVSVMRKGRRESAVCDLCLERPRTAELGDAVRRDRVRTAAGAETVKRVWPEPAKQPVSPAVVG